MTNQMPSQVQTVMNEQAIATDLLLTSKSAVRNCAYAVTETTTPSVRKVINQQLQQAVAFHEKVADYMINKGYYQPYDLQQQVQMDQQAAQIAVQGAQTSNLANDIPMDIAAPTTASMAMIEPAPVTQGSSFTMGTGGAGSTSMGQSASQTAGSSPQGAISAGADPTQNSNFASMSGDAAAGSTVMSGSTSPQGVGGLSSVQQGSSMSIGGTSGVGSTSGTSPTSGTSQSPTSQGQTSGMGASSGSNQPTSSTNIDINIEAEDELEDYNIYEDEFSSTVDISTDKDY